jgi:superfamily II DNA or RNA helicase
VTSETEALITPKIVGNAISHYRKHCDGALALNFAVSRKKSKENADLFNAAGIPALHIDGTTDTGLRDAMMSDFAARKVQVICNVDLFGEGYDCPALEAVIDTAPTASMGKYRQRVGRMLRPHEGKDYGIYLDCVGNSHLHGLPDDDIEWQLTTGRAEKKKNAVPAPRVCGYCFGASRSGSRVCRLCGEPFPVDGRSVEQVDGELAEVVMTPEQLEQRQRRIEQGMSKGLEQLVQLGRMRGMRNPERWAKHVLETREKKKGKAA